MGQEQSTHSSAESEGEGGEEEDDTMLKDDSTFTTRSTAASTTRSNNFESASVMSGKTNGSGSSSSASLEQSTRPSHKKSIHSRRRRKAARKEKKSGRQPKAPNDADPFSLHGMAVESLDVGSLPALLGSMISDGQTLKAPSKSVNRPSATTSSRSSSMTSQQDFVPLPSPTVVPSTKLHYPIPIRCSSDVPSMAQTAPHHGVQPIAQLDTLTLQRIVHPDDGGESLPPPLHETQRKINQFIRNQHRNTSTSSPVALQKLPNVARSAEDAAYLARLYDTRTWNMYKLITEARQDQNYQPPHSQHAGIYPTEAGMADSPADHMIFELDME